MYSRLPVTSASFWKDQSKYHPNIPRHHPSSTALVKLLASTIRPLLLATLVKTLQYQICVSCLPGLFKPGPFCTVGFFGVVRVNGRKYPQFWTPPCYDILSNALLIVLSLFLRVMILMEAIEEYKYEYSLSNVMPACRIVSEDFCGIL